MITNEQTLVQSFHGDVGRITRSLIITICCRCVLRLQYADETEDMAMEALAKNRHILDKLTEVLLAKTKLSGFVRFCLLFISALLCSVYAAIRVALKTLVCRRIKLETFSGHQVQKHTFYLCTFLQYYTKLACTHHGKNSHHDRKRKILLDQWILYICLISWRTTRMSTCNLSRYVSDRLFYFEVLFLTYFLIMFTLEVRRGWSLRV